MVVASKKKTVPVSKLEDLAGLGPVSLANLLKADITNFSQLLAKTSEEISSITGLTPTATKKVLDHAAKSYTFKVYTALEHSQKSKNKNFTSTNSIVLDSLLRGGIEEGSTYEFYGAFGSGKTQIVFSTIACFLEDPKHSDKKVLIIDTENTFVSTRLEEILSKKKIDKETIEKLLARVFIFQPKTVEEQLILFKRLREDGGINTNTDYIKLEEIKYIAVDSLVCLFRSSYLGRGTLQERQQTINSYLADLDHIVQDTSSFCIFTNQVISSPDPYSPDMIPVGGNIVAHASTHRIRLKRYAGGYRSARVMDSPNLPEEEVKFRVDEAGVID